MARAVWPGAAAVAVALLVAFASRAAAAGTPFYVSTCGGTVFDSAALACDVCGTGVDKRAASNSSATRNVYGDSTQCACATGYVETAQACDYTSASGCPAPTCTSCVLQGMSSSALNASQCMACDGTTTGLNVLTGDCGCPNPTGTTTTTTYALVEATATGSPLASKACVACGPRSRVFLSTVGSWAADPTTCRSCADPHATLTAAGDCVCDAGYRATGVVGLFTGAAITCVPATAAAAATAAYPEASAITIAFSSVQTTVDGPATNSLSGRTSATIQHYYLAAATACATLQEGGNVAPCQTLANLCVMHMYAPSSTPCALYARLYTARKAAVHGFQGWPSTLPMLNYGSDSAAAVTADTALARQMSFDSAKEPGTSDTLQFYLAKYALNGTFLGLELLGSQLQYCTTASTGTAATGSATSWTTFGYSYTATWRCDLRTLLASDFAASPVFYDLYVRDLQADAAAITAAASAAAAGNRASSNPLPLTLYPVPVAITNYVAADGSTPNVNKAWGDEANDVYVRRFTLADAATGVQSASQPPVVLRYASSLRLTIKARRDGGGTTGRPNLLSVPVLTVTYVERLASDILADATTGKPTANGYGTSSVDWSVDYTTDNSEYGRTVLALAVSLGMLVLAFALVRLTSWIRMNARAAFEAAITWTRIAQFIQILATTFAPTFFWFLWAMTLYWLLFFKIQTQVFALLPAWRPAYSDNEYNAFTAALLTIFICFIGRIIEHMIYQVRVDLFFIDWEKPRGALVRQGADHEAALGKSGVQAGLPGAAMSAARFAPISIWRTIHAANEWAELSTARRLKLPFVLLVLVTLLEAGGLKYVATPHPNVYDTTPGSLNPLLQFANNVWWWLIVAGIQLLYTVLLGERYINENPVSRFIDVCTVSKVSLLLLDHKYHGYYLHANAPHEHADGDMKELSEHLYEEASAMRLGRGLPGCPDPGCQSFELHLPALWRSMYDRVYRRLLDAESAAVESQLSVGGGGGAGGGGAWGAARTSTIVGSSSNGGAVPGGGGGVTSLMAASQVAKAKEKTVRLAAAFATLNAFLKGFIEETDPDYKRVWRQRTLVQQTFDMPPDMLTEAAAAAATSAAAAGQVMMGTSAAAAATAMASAPGSSAAGGGRVAYAMTDNGYRFERVLFRGIELDLLIFDILVFCVTDYYQQSPPIAAVVTYIVASALAVVRSYLGRRNMTYKTLIDSRFLE